MEAIDEALLSAWSNAPLLPELHLPAPNPYLPEQLMMKPIEKERAEKEEETEEEERKQNEDGKERENKVVDGNATEGEEKSEEDEEKERREILKKNLERVKRLKVYPDVVHHSPSLTVYHKQDSTFKLPKGNVFLQFLSPAAYLTPVHSVCTALYSQVEHTK